MHEKATILTVDDLQNTGAFVSNVPKVRLTILDSRKKNFTSIQNRPLSIGCGEV